MHERDETKVKDRTYFIPMHVVIVSCSIGITDEYPLLVWIHVRTSEQY